jgi:glycosyltransferase involved in cell wall biosynthesis
METQKKNIRVGLLGLGNDYDPAFGQGAQRYMYELYRRMKNNSVNISIERTGSAMKLPFVGNSLSFMFGNMTMDFSTYDIVHNPDPKPFVPLNMGKALLITTVHDFQPVLAPTPVNTNDSGWAGHMLWQPIASFGMRKALDSDWLIARSTLTRNEAVGLGCDKSHIVIISDGVDERYFSRLRIKRHKDFVIGYLGAFSYYKNVGFAINAIKKIDSQIAFEIWGKQGRLYNQLVALADNDKRIKFMGFAPENRIVDIYDGFDVFVFPSMYEGFGLPIIEAQARGLPVVICKKAHIPKEVRRYCFEASDETHMANIIEHLKANGYNEKLKRRSMNYARSFTWEKEALETLAVYRKAYGSR